MTPRTPDRMRDFGGGVDMYHAADALAPNQSTLMSNVIVNENLSVRTRYGFQQVGAASFASNVTAGAVSGMLFFSNPTNTEMLIVSESVLAGTGIFSWNGSTWSGAWPVGRTLLSGANVTFCQGLDTMIIADGNGYPIYWDGTTINSGNFTPYTANDGAFLEGCTIFCWSAGRMMASGNATYPDTIFCSNLGVGSGAGYTGYLPYSLNSNVSNWSASTLSFRIGSGDGEAIVALAPMQNQNVVIFKTNSVWLMNMNSSGLNPVNPIANWTAAQQGDLVGAGVGCVGRDAWLLYQNDVMFMSQQGVQSLQRMQAAAGQYQLVAPLSINIQPLIDRINWSQAQLIKGVKYRQLAIFLVPLDSSTSNNYALVWDGILGVWTGYWLVNGGNAVAGQFSGIEQLFMGDGSSGAYSGLVSVWQDIPGVAAIDGTYVDYSGNIPCEVDTRAFTFGNPDASKKMRDALFRFNTGNANVQFSVQLDNAPSYTFFGQLSVSGSILGGPDVLGPLPGPGIFTLENEANTEVYSSLSGLQYFNEAIFQISSQQGWFELRNITAEAFLKPIRNPNA